MTGNLNVKKYLNMEIKSCPCLHLEEPCNPRCSCKNIFHSYGCDYCCTYGSETQQSDKAIFLARFIKEGIKNSRYHKATKFIEPIKLTQEQTDRYSKELKSNKWQVYFDIIQRHKDV